MPTPTFTVRASIEQPLGDADVYVGSWEVQDDFGLTSRGVSLQAGEIGQLQAGNEVIIQAGYDTDRVTLMRGRIDTSRRRLTPAGRTYSVAGRDQGMKEIGDARVTFVWEARPPFVLPRAHDILRQACADNGIGVGALGFPDYPLYASYVAQRKPLLEVVEDLLEPWNQFARIQHLPIVREKTLSVLRIEWPAPPATGYTVPWSRQGALDVDQREYSEAPRLNEVDDIIIRGASYTQLRPDLGVERRYVYNLQRRVDRQILESFAGTYTDFVWLEVFTLEEREEGKVTHTEETHYQGTVTNAGNFTDSLLVKTITVDYEYFVPNQAIQALVAFEPISLRDALLWGTVETREEIDPDTGVFGPAQRTFKQYFYNDNNQQTSEQESIQEYDTADGRWKPAQVTVRTHSQTTSSTVRTQVTSYIVDADNDNELTTDFVDSQQVGGQLSVMNASPGRDDVESVQVQFPPLEMANGVPTERTLQRSAWIYENPYLGLDECEAVYNLAVAERDFQRLPYRWETAAFENTLDPNLWVGEPVRVEVEEGVFEDYWVESVRHAMDVNGARSSGTARRLTLEDLT